jgi:hypothetical protein
MLEGGIEKRGVQELQEFRSYRMRRRYFQLGLGVALYSWNGFRTEDTEGGRRTLRISG